MILFKNFWVVCVILFHVSLSSQFRVFNDYSANI